MKEIKEYKANQGSGLLLNANEYPENLEASIRKEIQNSLYNIAYNRYPDNDATLLRETYAKVIGVDSSQLMVGNGSDEMLGMMITSQLSKGEALYVLQQDFSMYDFYAQMNEVRVVRFDYTIKDTFQVQDFIKYGKKHGISMIVLSNPNNPTGRVIPKNELIQILQAFHECKVIIDEAYVEFYGNSMIQEINHYSNLFVTRTLSKAYSLASIRCGFLIGQTSSMDNIRFFKVPYNVNALTQEVAVICLKHFEKAQWNINQIIDLRNQMYEDYKALQLTKVTLYESKANFFYGETLYLKRLETLMEEAGIVIRIFDATSFRISVGNQQDNNKVLSVLQAL